MAIDSINNNVTGLARPNKSAAKQTGDVKNPPADTAISNADMVSITSTAKDINNASKKDASEPVVNESRVDAIKAALRDGSYQINPERVATRMLQLETHLPDTT